MVLQVRFNTKEIERFINKNVLTIPSKNMALRTRYMQNVTFRSRNILRSKSGRWATGELAAAITWRPYGRTEGRLIVTGPPLQYVNIVEEGTEGMTITSASGRDMPINLKGSIIGYARQVRCQRGKHMFKDAMLQTQRLLDEELNKIIIGGK